MDLCLFHLRRCQGAGFVEYVIGYRKLANTMEQRARTQSVDLALRQAQHAADTYGVDLDAAYVTHAIAVAGIYGARERLDGGEVNTTRLAYLTGLLREPLHVYPIRGNGERGARDKHVSDIKTKVTKEPPGCRNAHRCRSGYRDLCAMRQFV
jgi:hypothetical protein